MQECEMLAGLLAQAEGDGADLLTLRAVVEEASQLGAERALDRLGLSDAAAADDMRELRELLRGWRDAKRAARRAVFDWIVRVAVALLVLTLAWRSDLWPGLRP